MQVLDTVELLHLSGLIYCEDLADRKFNAPHHFMVVNPSTGNDICKIDFQEGPIKEVGNNGVKDEELIAMIIARLEAFQESEYSCSENAVALEYLYAALHALNLRTNRRTNENTEGTNIKDK